MRMETPTGFPTFSALHLLRSYNQFLLPSVTDTNLAYSYSCSSVGEVLPEDQPRSPAFTLSPLLGPFHPYPHYTLSSDLKANKYQAFISTANVYGRRPRGEKKPIPEEQKDDRYYERRKRNNQAAKKSRDARKLREDQIALRATLLEHENAVLRAQLSTLREETESLRQLMLAQKKNPTAVPKVESCGDASDERRAWQYGKNLNEF